MNILVINCGSSSIKFQLFDMQGSLSLASGLLERIAESNSRLQLRNSVTEGSLEVKEDIPDHAVGMARIYRAMQQLGVLGDGKLPDAIGHRVVHGGEFFSQPARLDPENLEKIRQVIPLAPLHNPINLTGIEVSLAHFPDLPQFAVFDTAFHQTMPERAWRYALPEDWYSGHGVRRYGFHGTSHGFVATEAARHLSRALDELNLITLHLGNGASACAIEGGRSIDTSMGLTPLEGLIMGTRCGDMDPAIPAYMEREIGLSPEQIDDALNRQSGLKALCGEYDMRQILAREGQGDKRAALAIEMYVYRLRKYIGAYMAALGRLDALVFTGGVGEHAVTIRERVCAGLEQLGILIDSNANQNPPNEPFTVSRGDSPVAILVVPTDEELEIARQTAACLAV
jgi:acetate kinase